MVDRLVGSEMCIRDSVFHVFVWYLAILNLNGKLLQFPSQRRYSLWVNSFYDLAGASQRIFKATPHKSSAAGWRVFSPVRAVWKTGNTPSIPLFSKLSAEEKSHATGSCRIVRCCLNLVVDENTEKNWRTRCVRRRRTGWLTISSTAPFLPPIFRRLSTLCKEDGSDGMI